MTPNPGPPPSRALSEQACSCTSSMSTCGSRVTSLIQRMCWCVLKSMCNITSFYLSFYLSVSTAVLPSLRPLPPSLPPSLPPQDTLVESGYSQDESEEVIGRVISVLNSNDHLLSQSITILEEVCLSKSRAFETWGLPYLF